MIEKVPNNISSLDIKITDKEGNSFFMIFMLKSVFKAPFNDL